MKGESNQMVTCSKCGTSFEVSLALVTTGDIRVARCRVCPVDKVYAICERCADLNRVENNPFWISLLPESFNPNNIITSKLEGMLLPTAGAIQKTANTGFEYDGRTVFPDRSMTSAPLGGGTLAVDPTDRIFPSSRITAPPRTGAPPVPSMMVPHFR